MNRNKEACHCRKITYGMIEDAVKNGAATVEQVQAATGAGKSCGKCKEYLEILVKAFVEELKADNLS